MTSTIPVQCSTNSTGFELMTLCDSSTVLYLSYQTNLELVILLIYMARRPSKKTVASYRQKSGGEIATIFVQLKVETKEPTPCM